jgi:hypothetical protein
VPRLVAVVVNPSQHFVGRQPVFFHGRVAVSQSLQASRTQTVVDLALLRVCQDAIRLGDGRKHSLGFL